MEAILHTFEEVNVGQSYMFTRTWNNEDIFSFAKLSGDTNPLHTDLVYASTTIFKKPIVHGMLLAATFSQFVGMYLPGKLCLYLSQTLSFKKPVYSGDMVSVEGVVIAKSESTRVLTISLTMKKGEEIVVSGEAKVKVL